MNFILLIALFICISKTSVATDDRLNSSLGSSANNNLGNPSTSQDHINELPFGTALHHTYGGDPTNPHPKKTFVVLYEHNNFRGDVSYCKDLEDASYYSFPYMENKHSSVILSHGTCAKLYDYNPPGGGSIYIRYPTLSIAKLSDYGFDNRCSSLRSCSRQEISTNCPKNTFVKKIETRTDGNLLTYFAAYCYSPDKIYNNYATRLVSHHNIPSLSQNVECFSGAVRGIQYTYTSLKHAYSNIIANCPAQGAAYCSRNQAVCGFTTSIEEQSNVIKQLDVKCCNVEDPAAFCNPKDLFETILVCDALHALGSTECKYTQTVGYSHTNSEGQGSTIEHSFYKETGFDFGIAGKGLSANFKHNIGSSNTTSYNWNTASSQTWYEETSTEITMTIPAGMKTELKQVVGKCSFFSVRSTYFKRIDTFRDGAVNVVNYKLQL